MRLKIGDHAPDFSAPDIWGKEIKLSDYSGKKVLLCFFRYAGRPWCNLAIYKLSKEYPRLNKLGLEVITFVQSTKEAIQEYIVSRHIPPPPFAMVPDPDKKIYNMYGVESSPAAAFKSLVRVPEWLEAMINLKFYQGKVDGDVFLVPAQFLIDPPNFTIKKARYGNDYADTMPFIEIQDFLLFDKSYRI